MALLASALGFSFFMFIYWWKEWIVALVALVVLNVAWKVYLHRRSIWGSKKE
jgi:hypothetical protein